MGESAGLYLHIPFCRSKCPYCDFHSVKYDPAAAAQYLARLVQEFDRYSGSFDTVYLGGGTPSILEPEQIAALLAAVRAHFTIAEDAEITIECNPSKDLARDFAVYAAAGVNRVSIGMQSAVEQERRALGRTASRAQVAKAIADAKSAGISNISLDVMLGTPQQTLASLDETFAFLAKQDVPHVSAYLLKLEPGTPFYRLQEKLALPDEDTVSEMYLKTVASLEALGLRQYEISNFARPGFASRHNLKYWQLAPYLGIGASAHSFWQGKRFYYDSAFVRHADGDGGGTAEEILLGLRLNQGIPTALVPEAAYRQFIDLKLMVLRGDRIALTPQGMLVSNTIIRHMLDCINAKP